MDKPATSPARGDLFEGDWRTKLDPIIDLMRATPAMREIRLDLPYGFDPRSETFSKISDRVMPENFLQIVLKKDRVGRLTVLLEQRFNLSLEKGFKLLKNEFSYTWDVKKGRAGVSRFLASFDLKTVEKNIAVLLKECTLFYRLNHVSEQDKEKKVNCNSGRSPLSIF